MSKAAPGKVTGLPQPKRGRGRRPDVPDRTMVLSAKTLHRKSMIDEVLYSGFAPLQIMLKVMMGDTSITPMQLKAAELAAPYVHPKLSAITVTGRFRSDMTRPDAPTLDHEDDDALPADPLEAARVYQRLLGNG